MAESLTKHLFFAKSTGARSAFCAEVFDEHVPRLRPLARGALKIGLTERDNPRLTVLPLRRENLLMVSAWGDIDPGAFVHTLSGGGREVFGYRVAESYPRSYERTWADGERSPGDVLLTLLAKNPKLSRDDFMKEWHGRHTPKALRIHPMWSYARNVVEEAVSNGAPRFEGVVEEHYETLADIINPVRMFGGARKFLPHMVEVWRHVGHFLDLPRTENYLLAEWHIQS